MNTTNSNIFEYGGRKQYNIIQPFLQQVFNLDKDSEYFIDNFMRVLEKASIERAEKETVPTWVIDIDDYVMKSEIIIVCGMLERLHLEGFLQANPQSSIIFLNLQKRLCQYGNERHWDLNVLKYQLYRLFSQETHNPFYTLTEKRMCQGSDYN